MLDLSRFDSFEWDDGNSVKNWKKHGVRQDECEQVFFNRPLLLFDDAGHSVSEDRFFLLGCTDTGRKLFVVFTVRKNRIRVISAREMTKKERRAYLDHGS